MMPIWTREHSWTYLWP